MTTLTAPPAVRPDLSAGAPWLAPAAVLAAELAVRRQLPDDTAARVQHALGWVEDFYSTRQSLAANGDLKAVTASPILAEDVPNYLILRKTGADHLDWTASASQFVPFEVERD